MANPFLSAIPGVYAWQIYGWKTGLAVFVIIFVLLSVLAGTFLLRGWPLRWLLRLRIVLVVLTMIAIGLSAAERCNFEMTSCHRLFRPH
jgi:hypothetical protein